MSDRLSAEVSHDLCVGVGLCIRVAPHAFRYNGDKQAIFKGPGVWQPEQLREAADSCPMAAITVYEDDSSRVV